MDEGGLLTEQNGEERVGGRRTEGRQEGGLSLGTGRDEVRLRTSEEWNACALTQPSDKLSILSSLLKQHVLCPCVLFICQLKKRLSFTSRSLQSSKSMLLSKRRENGREILSTQGPLTWF